MLFEELMEKGQDSLTREDADSAIKYFSKACEVDPKSSEAYFYLGNAFQLKDNYYEAIMYYDKAIALKAEHPFFLTRGIAYAFLGNFQKAVEDCTKALEVKPEYADAYQMRGAFHDQLGEKHKAIADVQQAAYLLYSQNRLMEFIGTFYFLTAIQSNLISNNFQTDKIPIIKTIVLNDLALGTIFDVDLFKNSSPASVLKTLVLLRSKSIEELFNNETENIQEHFTYLIKPINPLILISAICIGIIKGYDYHSFIYKYISGDSFTEAEDHLLQLPEFDSDAELKTYLEIEAEYIKAYCLVTLENILCFPSTKVFFDPSPEFQPTSENLSVDFTTLQDYLKIAETFNVADELGFSIFHIYFYAYNLANPFYLTLSPKLVEEFLGNYGFSTNSKIHNIREHYEYQFELSKQRMNEILKNNISKEKKRIELENQKVSQLNASKLVERAFRFYYWNPVEASGKGVANELYKKMYGLKYLYR